MKRLVSFVIILSMLLSAVPTLAEDTSIPTASVDTIKVSTSRSGEISHPYYRDYFRRGLIGGDRAFINYSQEEKESKTAELRAKDLKELEEYVKLQMKSLTNSGTRPAFESLCAIMSIMAEDENDDYLMKQVITIIHTAAMESANVPLRDEAAIFYNSWTEIPSLLLFAYDIAFDNPYWDELTKIHSTDSRAVFEQWVMDTFDRVYNANIGRPLSNYAGYWIGHLAMASVVLNDPDRVRQTIELLDQALCSSQFFADGMWREGTFSYGQMLVGNCGEAVTVLSLYKDPDDYVDTKFGLKLDKTDLTPRWPIMSKYLNEVNNSAVYPNGAPVAINDNHFNVAFTYESPIKAENLKNTVLNHFGLYNIKYGNTAEAQQINLKYAPMSEGLPYASGHSHGDFLGLSMWSAGMEILPDGGYVFTPAANRYVHMNAYVHNCSWIYNPKAEPYGANATKYVRNNTYAYDDGSKNGKQIQLIEAESKHTAADDIDIKRRALMLIAVDENHSYTVDIQRLKGGIVHENFLRQVEEEDVELTTSLTLPEAQEGTLGTALKGMGKSGGIVLAEAAFKSPRIMTTDEDFDFIWKGKTTGVSMHAFLKGNPNATIAFSQFPTMRRVNNIVADKDKYPGYHFYQRQDVTPDDITIYGGVYEGYRNGEAGNVKNVEWIPAPDGDTMTQLVRVELADAVDYIYISNDNTPREYNGIIFSGDYAAIRLDKNEENVMWKYIYGEGNITAKGVELKGKKEHLYQVLSASGKLDDTLAPNQFRIKGVLPEEAEGAWGHTIYGDGSGVAFEITNADQSVVTLHNAPGFSLTPSGASKNNFPAYITPETGLIPDTTTLSDRTFKYQEDRRFVISGDVWFEVKIPTFEKY